MCPFFCPVVYVNSFWPSLPNRNCGWHGQSSENIPAPHWTLCSARSKQQGFQIQCGTSVNEDDTFATFDFWQVVIEWRKKKKTGFIFAHLKAELPLGILKRMSYQSRWKADCKSPTVGLFGMRTKEEGTQDIICQEWGTTVAVMETKFSTLNYWTIHVLD